MRPIIAAALCIAAALPAQARLAYLGFLGKVTKADTTPIVLAAGIRQGMTVRYLFAVDMAKDGFVRSDTGRAVYHDTTVTGNGYLDYFYDSLAGAPLFKIGHDTSVSLAGQVIRYDTGYVFTCATFIQNADSVDNVVLTIRSKNFAALLPATATPFTGREVFNSHGHAGLVLISGLLTWSGDTPPPGALRLPGRLGPGLEAGFDAGGLTLVSRAGVPLRLTLRDGLGRFGGRYLLRDRLVVPAADLPPGALLLRIEGAAPTRDILIR